MSPRNAEPDSTACSWVGGAAYREARRVTRATREVLGGMG
jgi:hypothetical protein